MAFALEQIRTRVLDRYPYFGSVAAGVCYKESFFVEAFGTDGEFIYYNPKSHDRFSEDNLVFLFAHELCHIAFNHIERSRDKNLALWGRASDAVTNALLISDGFEPAPGAVFIREALDCDAEQFYLMLLGQELPDKEDTEKNAQKSEDSSRASSNSNLDSETNAEQQSSASGSQNAKKSESGNNRSKNRQDEQNGGAPPEDSDDLHAEAMGKNAHSLWDKFAANKGDDEEQEEAPQPEEPADCEVEEDSFNEEQRVYKENKVKTKNQLAMLNEELSNQSNGIGTSTNSDIRQLGGIGESKPLLDWRRALKEEACFDVDWSYKNAVIENGVVTPHLEEMQYPVTEILLDTSGSIEETLLKSFLRECKDILQSSMIKVGCFDVMFYGFKQIREEKDIDEMIYKGGGGTNFSVAVNAFSRRVTNKIIFTDGDAEMPETPMDAIWIVFGSEEIRPMGGRVIRISPEQMNELLAR